MFADLSTRMSDLLGHPDEAYHDVLIVVLSGTAAVIVLHLILVLLGGRPASRRHPWNLWEMLVYLAALGSVAVLGVTSFYALLRFGHLDGWWLFIHMVGAGALVGVLPLLAMTWGRANRFGRTQNASSYAPKFFWVPKALYWLFLLSGLVVVLTMLLSMLPVFGTDGLLGLLDVHRYSGLLAVVALVLHFYCVLLQRFRLR